MEVHSWSSLLIFPALTRRRCRSRCRNGYVSKLGHHFLGEQPHGVQHLLLCEVPVSKKEDHVLQDVAEKLLVTFDLADTGLGTADEQHAKIHELVKVASRRRIEGTLQI